MDLTRLNAAIDAMPDGPAPLRESPSLFGRAGKEAANLPINIVEGLGQSAINLGEMWNPEGVTDKLEIPNFFDIAPPETFGEKATDFLVGKHGLADIVGQSLVPAGVVGKLGKAAGIAEGPGLEALKWGAGFAGPELGREEATGTDVGIAAALGTSQGGLSFLPRKVRLLPTLGVAALHALYESQQHDATTGLIAFGADVVGGMLPGAMKHPDLDVHAPATHPQESGLGLSEVVPDARNRAQFDEYKQGLATLQEEAQLRAAAEAEYQAGARGSLKEGVRLVNPEGLPDRVPTADFLQSFEATLPDRTSALGIVERKAIFHDEPQGPLEWEPARPADYEPTVGQTYAGFATLQPEAAGPIEGVLPRFSRPLYLPGELESPNPSTLFPVENFGGGPRSAEEIAAMQKALQFKKPRAPRKPKAPKVEEPAPVAEPVRVEPEPAPAVEAEVEATPATLSREEADYQRKQFAKQTPEQLRDVMSFYDEQIADTVEAETKSHYYALKQMAKNALERAEPKAAAVEAEVTAKAERTFKQGQRVVYKDIFGQEQHGTYKGSTSDGRAKVVFEGDKDTTMLSHTSLSEAAHGEVPEIATLQKGKGAVFTEEDENFLSKWLNEQKLTGELDEMDPTNAGQDFNFESRGTPSANEKKIATLQTTLPKDSVRAIEKVVEAIKGTVNRHLDISFKSGENFDVGVPAMVNSRGHISVNRDKLIERFDNWNRFNPAEKAFALAEVSRWLGHEAGHTILNFLGLKDKALMRKLMNEFRELGQEGRELIIKDFHDTFGKSDTLAMRYASGTDVAIEYGYGLHARNKDAVEFMGLHEFFAEMSAAHIFGKLKEELLPHEMKNLWTKFKDLMRNLVSRLFHDPIDDIDSILAYKNFKQMLGELHDRFSLLTKEEMEVASKSSEPLIRERWAKIAVKDAEIRRKVELDNYASATYRNTKRARQEAEGFIENPEYIPGDEMAGEFATLQSHFNAPPTQMQQNIVGNRGFIQSEIARHLGMGIAGGVIGGIAGPKLSKGQMTVAEGVFAGAVLGFAGPIALRRLFMTAPQANSSTFHHMSAKEAFKKLFTLSDLSSLGGDAATGMGSAPAKFIRWMERNTNLHLPPELFNAIVKAEGPASYAVQIASDAFEKARTFKTNAIIDTAVEKYLRGATTVSDLRRVLGPDAAAQEFGNFIVTGRQSIGLLQEMLASGLRDGSFKTKVLDSLSKGDYLTRQYRMFHDVDYKPTQQQIEAVALELTHANPHYDLSTSRQLIEDYLHQIATERGMFAGGRSDVGQKLDAAVFQKRNDRLSTALRDALGEYKDPKEQVMGTIRHLYTNAISAKFYDQVATMTDKIGLKMSYSREEHGAAIDAIKARLAHPPTGTTPEQIATLQKQLKDLQFYVPLESQVKYGKIGGKMVNRFVRDQLASFDSPWGLMDGSIMRTLGNFHNYVKIGRTALNPITVVRNMVAAPILMGLSRANPLHSRTALAAMKNLSSGLGKEMLEQGIYGVDQVRGEFFRTAEQILMGDYDHHGIEGIFKSGLNKVLEFYRMPDMLVRGNTYISAKMRFAEKFQLPENHPTVIDAARDWTNRYTVNYANVAPIVKSLRQVPFSNLFISYTAEITRIAKNLVMDVFQHPDAGQRVFAAGAIGGLTAIPFLMEKASVAALSPADRKEWETSQAQMPDYSRSRFRVVLGKEGNRFRYLDITPLLQIDSLLQMMRTVGQRDVKGFLAVNPVFGWENTPVMNIVAEQISGKDLRTGRPIDNTVTQRMQEVLKEVVPPIVPGGYEYQRASEALSLTEGGERGQTNLRTGRRTTPGELVTSYLTGMRLTTVDTRYLHRNTIADAKRQIANEASYLRDIASTNLPVSTKKKALDRYQTAVQDILKDMHSKLDGELP